MVALSSVLPEAFTVTVLPLTVKVNLAVGATFAAVTVIDYDFELVNFLKSATVKVTV
jgi:hypothetical protein